MAEDDLLDVVGPEEMAFKLTFERKECIRGREFQVVDGDGSVLYVVDL